MGHRRERITDAQNHKRDWFTVRWDFIHTWLAHVEVDDAEQVLRDLVDLEHGLNAR